MSTPESIFSQIRDFSEDLRDISLNGSTLATAKKLRPGDQPRRHEFSDTPIPSPQVDNTHNSSLGILGNSGLGSFSVGDTTTNSLIFPSISSSSSVPSKKLVSFHPEQMYKSDTEIDGGPLDEEDPEIKFTAADFKELDAAYTPSASDTEADNDPPTRDYPSSNPLVDLGLVASYTSSSFATQLVVPPVQSSSDELAKPLESSQPVQDQFVKPLPPMCGPTPRSLSRPRPLISTPQQGLPQNLLEPAFNQSDASSIVDGTPQLPPRVPVKRGPAFDSLIQNFQNSMANSPFIASSADNSDFPWEKVLQGETSKTNFLPDITDSGDGPARDIAHDGPARDIAHLLKPKNAMDVSEYSDAPFRDMSHLLRAAPGDVSAVSEAPFQDMSHLLRPKDVDASNIGDPLDPSFCSGKMSGRSTSIGGGDSSANTRDENFSDFTKPASFQGSFMSQYSNQGKFGDVSSTSSVPSAQIIDEKDESVFHSGSFPLGTSFKNAAINPFDFGDVEPQRFEGNFSGSFPMATTFPVPVESPFGGCHDLHQQGAFGLGDEDFQYGSQGKNMKDFFDKEEEENLKEHQFLEEEQMEDVPNQSTASVFSGVSDKSIFLKNSNLWAGDTSKVDLVALRQESERKMTRCEYFRHNSSRLGSLEDSVAENERPELGFVHKIRSPVRKPMSLLSDSQIDDNAPRGEVVFKPSSSSSSCQPPGPSSDICGSGPSSTDTTFSVPSGDSTKTVVSLMDHTGTLKAADLVSRLEAFVRSNANSSRVAVDHDSSGHQTKQGDGSAEEFNVSTASATSQASEDINVSTISKILSEASISQDPQQFVNLILNCVKRKVAESPNTSVASTKTGVNLEEIVARLSDSFNSVSNNESLRTFQVEGSPGRDPQSPLASTSFRSGISSASDTPVLANKSQPVTDTPVSRGGPITDTPTSTGGPRKISMYTSGKKLTPRQSELARMRLPGPSNNSFHKRLTGGITPLPAKGQIKPFGNTRSVPVASAKPFKRTIEEPNSMGSPQLSMTRRNAPNISRSEPSSGKEEEVPKMGQLSGSLNSSTRQRRPSNARHSSPIKEVRPKGVTIQAAPASVIHASRDLSSLFEDHTPTLAMASNKQLHTSTPYYQPDMNLSMVIMNQLTQNKSITPVLNPEVSINPENLDVSTISPDLYTTLRVATHVTPKAPFTDEVNIPAVKKTVHMELPDDYHHTGNLLSHIRNTIQVSLTHNLDEPIKVILKVIKVWLGSVLVPVEYWSNVLKVESEKILTILPETRAIPIQVSPCRAGAFSLNLGLAMPDGSSTSGLVRFQAEEPNVQILTENGSQVDFGTMPEDCRSSVSLQVVNSGSCLVPITLKINRHLAGKQSFYFLDDTQNEVDEVSFFIPGVSNDSKEGEGLAKEVAVWAKTSQIDATDPQIVQSYVNVILGDNSGGVTLGKIETLVRAGKAKLRTKKSLEPVVFSCLPGGKCHKKIPLMNSGNIPLRLEVSFDNDNDGCFACEKCVNILPNSERIFDVTFNCPMTAAADSRSSTMFLKVLPGGLTHMISIEIDVLSRSQDNYKENSGPVLSFGTLKKPLESTSPLRERNDKELAPQHKLPDKFPVESDRSLVNWFSVPVGTSEEQTLTLRNTLSEPIALTVIIRDSASFKLIFPAGQVSTSEIVLGPQATKDVRMAFCPGSLGIHRGKLVLKPQGRSVSGKTFKASISLVGVVGSASVAISGVEKKQEKESTLFLGQVEEGQNVSRTITVTNSGNGAAFVKFLCVEELDGVVVAGEGGVNAAPNTFILEIGQTRKVAVNLPSVSLLNAASGISTIATLAMFSGPELCRQVLKRARRLPGAAKICSNPALLGVNFDCVFSGEESLNPAEIYTGHLTNLDVKHLYNKADKQLISLTALASAKQANFDALSIEETLSESRLDGRMSIAPHSPPTRGEDVLSSQLVISPSQVVLEGGSDGLLTLINRGVSTVHWDMSWPGASLSVQPPAGELCGGGQAMIVITAESRATVNGWTGNIQVYSDNNVSSVEVVVKPVKQVKTVQVSVSPSSLDMGLAVVGQTVSGVFKVINPSGELIQWKAAIEPGMFSLPQTTGLLNPAQSVALAVTFSPTAAGAHVQSILVNTYIFKGSSTGKETGSPVLLSISGTGMSVLETTTALPAPATRQSTEPAGSATMAPSWKGATTLPRPREQSKAKQPVRRGSITLEKELIEFPATRVGETSVAKIKIKNRRLEDQAVEILPLDPEKPFKTVHTVIEVKSQCYCTLPVQFKPVKAGQFSSKINMRAGGRILIADLVGNAR